MVDTTAVPALYIVGILGRWVAIWNIPIQLLRLTRDTDVIGTVPSVVWPLQEIPVLLSWFVFLARKRLGKIREGKAVALVNWLIAWKRLWKQSSVQFVLYRSSRSVWSCRDRNYGRTNRGTQRQFSENYLFGRRFEVQNFRIIFWKISCLPASPRIFKLCPKKVT